jgi:hypothetical protein
MTQGTVTDIATQQQNLDGTLTISIRKYQGLISLSKKRDFENPGSASFHALRV